MPENLGVWRRRKACTMGALVVGVLLCSTAVGCAGRQVLPAFAPLDDVEAIRGAGGGVWLADVRPFARASERHVWRLSFAGIHIGRGVVDVSVLPEREVGAPRTMVVTWSVEVLGLAAQLFSANMHARTWVDGERGHWTAMEFAGDASFGRHTDHIRARAVRDDAAGVIRATSWDDTDEPHETTRRIDARNRHDLGTLFLMMRGWDAQPRAYGLVELGKTAGGVGIEVVVEGRETIVTPMGVRAAVRIAGFLMRSDRRRFTLWISNDGDRVPLRLEMPSKYGVFVIEAVRYTHG